MMSGTAITPFVLLLPSLLLSGCAGGKTTGARGTKLMSVQTALSELHQTASLATFSGDALTDLLAGLAANSIGSFVKDSHRCGLQ